MAHWLKRLRQRGFDPHRYWQQRFAQRAMWEAVGQKGFSKEQLRDAMHEKLDWVASFLKRIHGTCEGLRLLDAGCGFGFGTETARGWGYQTAGVDFVASAVDQAKGLYPQCSFLQGDLSTLKLKDHFDAIMTIDTLINVVDAAVWRDILKTFSDHLADEGVIVVVERLRRNNEQIETPPHVLFRTLEEYASQLSELGLEITHHERKLISAQGHEEDVMVIQRTVR